MNARLRIMVASREIEEADAPDQEVVVRWRKAIGTWSDAAKDLGDDSRLTLYYQAGLQAATTLIRAAGFRVLGSDHHRHTFEALRALDPAALSTVAREMNAFRRSRHQAVYDWEESAAGNASNEAARVEALARSVDRMLRIGHAWLVENRPGIARECEEPAS